MNREIAEKNRLIAVADLNECDSPAVQEADEVGVRDSSAMRVAAGRWWPEVPHAYGGQIAWALRHIGIHARISGPEHAILMNGHVEVGTLPLHRVVHPAILSALLSTLGITAQQLAEYLEDP